jgi:trigger factor
VKSEFDAQFGEINEKISLPGFRPGKAPRKLLESKFGPHVRDEVKGKLVEAGFKQAVEEKKVTPLGRPTLAENEVVVDPAKAFEFAFEVTTRPEFELPTWKGLEVKAPLVEVTDADVESGVDTLRMQQGTLEATTEPLVLGDVALVDWQVLVDGVEAHREEGAYYRLGRGVLEGVLLEGADAALAGGKAGTSVTVRVRAAPDDPRAARRAGVRRPPRGEGRQAVRPGPLDEAFLKRHDFDDVDELRRDAPPHPPREGARARPRGRGAPDGRPRGPSRSRCRRTRVGGWAERKRIEAQEAGRAEEELTAELAADEAKVRAQVETDLRRHAVLDRIAEAEGLSVSEQAGRRRRADGPRVGPLGRRGRAALPGGPGPAVRAEDPPAARQRASPRRGRRRRRPRPGGGAGREGGPKKGK